ncbi:hypothetical protein DSECCO2_622980 [anaerobic digester metagenome]
MLPPTKTLRPFRSRMLPMSVVVVVLPLVPVTAMMGSDTNQLASSSSDTTCAPSGSREATLARGMPGLSTTRVAPWKSSGLCSPPRTSKPWSVGTEAATDSLRSSSRTVAPRRTNRREAAIPDEPAPSTTAVCPRS